MIFIWYQLVETEPLFCVLGLLECLGQVLETAAVEAELNKREYSLHTRYAVTVVAHQTQTAVSMRRAGVTTTNVHHYHQS